MGTNNQGSIHELDKDTINKIAAGEVVERPLAVVKELVENAIDAGADAITVEIKDGGKQFIRVTDNGSGIAREDVRSAFKAHATSKITNAMDIMGIKSLGFRGEALSSIAAVSKVEMLTKTEEDFLGYKYEISGGEELSFEEAGCPKGTTIIVRNLFYNTPARLKFLKTGMTEGGYIADIVEMLSLSHPDIAFRFISSDKLRINTSGNGDLKEVIYHIYGREITSNIMEINTRNPLCDISGYLGKPVISRGNAGFLNYFING